MAVQFRSMLRIRYARRTETKIVHHINTNDGLYSEWRFFKRFFIVRMQIVDQVVYEETYILLPLKKNHWVQFNYNYLYHRCTELLRKIIDTKSTRQQVLSFRITVLKTIQKYGSTIKKQNIESRSLIPIFSTLISPLKRIIVHRHSHRHNTDYPPAFLLIKGDTKTQNNFPLTSTLQCSTERSQN